MALSVVEVLYILNKPDDPGYKMTWIVMILLAPVFGGLVYLVCGGNGLTRRVRRKMEGMSRHLRETLEKDRKAESLSAYGRDAVNQSRYLEEHGFCPLYTNTATKYFSLGDDAYGPILEELAKLYLSGILHYRTGKILERHFGDPDRKGPAGGGCAGHL